MLQLFKRRFSNRSIKHFNSLATQLPPELIILILEHCLSPSVLSSQSRYSILSSISLVCKSWSYQSRLLLWSSLAILNDIEGKMVLKSRGLGKYETKYLEIDGTRVSPKVVEAVLKRVGKVGEVKIKDNDWYPGVHSKGITEENLTELKSLTLNNVILSRPFSPLPTSSSTPLRRLEITTRHSFLSSLPLSSNLLGIYSSSITNFSFKLVSPSTHCSDLLEFLNLIGGNLRTLTLILPFDSSLLPTLTNCINLKHLIIHISNDYLTTLVRSLRCQLQTLTIRTTDFGKETLNVPGVLNVLKEKSLEELEWIRFAHWDRKLFGESCGGEEVLRRFKKIGVEVRFGEEEG